VGRYDEAVYWQSQACQFAPAELREQLRERVEELKRRGAAEPSEGTRGESSSETGAEAPARQAVSRGVPLNASRGGEPDRYQAAAQARIVRLR